MEKMKAKCSHCQKILSVPDEYKGKRIKCPACNQILVAKPMTEAPEPPIPEQPALPESKRNLWITTIVVATGLAWVIGFACGALMTRANKEETKTVVAAIETEMDKARFKEPEHRAEASTEGTNTLKYRIVAREDVSYAGTPRMVFRVVVNVDQIPSGAQLKKAARQIREDGNTHWKEFTVFTYLPDMDTGNVAYAVAEFRPYGLKEFRIQDFALYGTKWRSLEEEKKQADEEWKKQKQNPKVKEYQVNLGVKKSEGREIRISIDTDFPNGTNLHVSVRRTYYEKGKPEEYSGDIFSKDMAVQDGRIDLVVNVNDSRWYKDYYERARKFGEFIDFPGIERISPNIEISVLFSPRREQPKGVLKILGINGEFIKGSGAERTGNFTTYSLSKEVNIPFER